MGKNQLSAGNGRRRSRTNGLLLAAVGLSVVSLFLEGDRFTSPYVGIFTNVLDFTVLSLFLSEIAVEYVRSPFKRSFIRKNAFNIGFLAVFVVLFAYNKVLSFTGQVDAYRSLPTNIIIVRNLFVLLKVFSRIRKLTAFVRSITTHPARTVMLSFVLVILTGTIVLRLPFATADGEGLPFIDSLFTSTSAVCVTGLIVVDTATRFSFWGQLAILILIQVGGLGIMILSFFGAYVLRRSLTLEDKFLLAYMLSEKDMRSLGKNIRSIMYLTFGIEAAGAVLLYIGFGDNLGFGLQTVFLSVFHAVSAFCNAGFSLFSDNLEGFQSDLIVNLSVSLLILCGGLSFAVLINLFRYTRVELSRRILKQASTQGVLSPNTKVVLIATIGLIVSAMLAFYALEHSGVLGPLEVGTQYLAGFFQAVTLRTAGFNTVGFSQLRPATYLVMAVFMFVGAASGSTAGGIKVNSVAAIGSYIASVLRNRQRPLLFGHSVSMDAVLKSFLILLFGIGVVIAATIVLSVTEVAPFEHVLFEAVSAFGTVGLSAGITFDLSGIGKVVVMLLMFTGRIGPLTILIGVLQKRGKRVNIEYPECEIMVG